MKQNKTAVRPTLAQACARYVHRFTMEHVPEWARRGQMPNGRHYAPQFRSDAEWYANTVFPGEPSPMAPEFGADNCYTSGQTWPLGATLAAPYVPRESGTDARREALADKLAHCRDVWIDARRGLADNVHVHGRVNYTGVADALHYAMESSRREARECVAALRSLKGAQSCAPATYSETCANSAASRLRGRADIPSC